MWISWEYLAACANITARNQTCGLTNEGYGLGEALPVLRKMERFDLEYIEQPLPRWDVEGLSADTPGIPHLADESVFTPEDAMTPAAADKRLRTC